ncbi:ankyrin [Karstenula rhodostoma CBS 690.94]|uniref:Ankyrin n=1 Tax=Karstenula rhodostoma CBS 690.94 TaxID=1392251 RepID=A0A9P4U7N0_9PLEO|nr:ankyrin [Karstenula rhodostoma CBS 690.94]
MSAQNESSDYRLTDADLEEYPIERHHFDPVVRAAANPDSRVLAAILALKDPYLNPSTFDGRQSALTSAIEAGLLENVKILVNAGCDPNGVPYDSMLKDAAYFWGLLPHWSPLGSHRQQQSEDEEDGVYRSPLDDEDIRSRQKTRLPFWSAPVKGYPVRGQKPLLTALDAAVVSENIDLIEAVLDAGADTKAWTERHDAMPENPSVSFISPSTPLHRAIETGNTSVARLLLSKGFRVDVFPLAAVTRCLNPLMFSLATRSPDLSWYALLSASPTAAHDQLSPIFKVHIAHIACATLSIAALEAVANHVPLSDVRPTALGHTLLHIACLPSNDDAINHFSPKIHQSIHDVRTLAAFTPHALWPFKPPGQFRDVTPQFSAAPSELEPQLAMIAFLTSHGMADWTARDVHGNTPLHYLAAHRAATAQTLAAGLAEERLGSAWAERNSWGYTPAELVGDGEDALRGLAGEGRTPESVSYMPHWRDAMGSWIAGKWTSSYPEDQ